MAFAWSGPSDSGQPAPATADAQGAVAFELTPGTAPGMYTITATGSKSGRSAQEAVTVTQVPITLSLSAPSVAAGEKFTVSARGFDDGEKVTFTLDGNALGTVAAQDGQASLEATAPDTPGKLGIAATGRTQDRRASALLQVTGRDLSGTWRLGNGRSAEMRKTSTGWEVSQAIEDVDSGTGCLFRAGEVGIRIFGSHPNYTSELLWSDKSNGQNCQYKWANATSTTVSADGNRIELESINPFNGKSSRQIITR